MRFVEIKTPEQQSVLMLHRIRQLLVRQRTTVINGLRGHLAEFGIVAGVGRNGLERLLGVIEDDRDERTPPPARDCLMALLTSPTFLLNQRSSVSVDAGPRFDPTDSGYQEVSIACERRSRGYVDSGHPADTNLPRVSGAL